MKHLYKKCFEHTYEAEETAKAFHLLPGIDRLGPVDVSVGTEDGKHCVYVKLEGDVDPAELLAATGYERVS